jgi:hypothetical protein
MRTLLFPLTFLLCIGAGCGRSGQIPATIDAPPLESPVLNTSPSQREQVASIADFIRERRTFPAFSEVEGKARPVELEGMDGRNFLYVNNCPNRQPKAECQYRITLFAGEGVENGSFFLQETQAGKPTLFYGPMQGPVRTLVSAMNKVSKKTLYDIP